MPLHMTTADVAGLEAGKRLAAALRQHAEDSSTAIAAELEAHLTTVRGSRARLEQHIAANAGAFTQGGAAAISRRIDEWADAVVSEAATAVAERQAAVNSVFRSHSDATTSEISALVTSLAELSAAQRQDAVRGALKAAALKTERQRRGSAHAMRSALDTARLESQREIEALASKHDELEEYALDLEAQLRAKDAQILGAERRCEAARRQCEEDVELEKIGREQVHSRELPHAMHSCHARALVPCPRAIEDRYYHCHRPWRQSMAPELLRSAYTTRRTRPGVGFIFEPCEW